MWKGDRMGWLTVAFFLAGSTAFQDPPKQADVVDPLVRTSGALHSEALIGSVAIDYDNLGMPTIDATSRNDAYFAEGFVHAQNRFSQMDVSRRLAAGELAALVGPALLLRDRAVRPYRMRMVAREVVAMMTEEERVAIDSYAAGVNAGLADLRVPPPEYGILQAEPEDWTTEDTILVMLTFTLMLENSAAMDAFNAPLFEALPEELREFLYSPFSRHDAPIRALERRRPSLPRIPPREVISLRVLPEDPPAVDPPPDDEDDEEHGENATEAVPSKEGATRGSNNWAVNASRTHDGRAILANDPHLGLTLPIAWYRIRLMWPDHDLVGLSIPGIPGIIMGSNGHVAWGFTNSNGDFQDLIALEIDPENPDRYRVPEGWEQFGDLVETIDVAGGEPVELALKTTRWGVVNAEYVDASGKTHEAVTEWFALHPELINLEVLNLEDARTAQDALRVLGRWVGPPQNVVVADKDGHIGYTVTGFLPSRLNRDGRAPYGLWDGTPGFTTREQGVRPLVYEPVEGFVLSANNRTAGRLLARQLGYAWANPARAKRIENVLSKSIDTDEQEMLALQMDPTTIGLEPWKKIVLHVIPDDEQDESLAAAREAILDWNGRADIDQVGITLLEHLRSRMLNELAVAVATWAGEQELGSFSKAYMNEEPYLRVIEDEAPNWLPPGDSDSWHGWVRAHVRDAVENDALVPWGERNQVTISSPFVALAPEPMSRMLKIDTGPQSGYWNSPKVLGPGFGASARLVVSPGHEEDGILLMPGGQSGNPFSPHFRSLNAAWVAGDPMPLLPGDSVVSFSLEPGSAATPDGE